LNPSRALLLFSLSLGILGPAVAQDKPIVYNDMEGDGGAVIDRRIREAYRPRFTLVDTSTRDGYSGPEPVAGEMPKSPATESGQLLGGYVLAVYLVSAQGLVTDPVVLTASDPRLADAALRAMAQWRFKPARLNGAPVASTAAQEFNFGPIDVSNGYAMKRLGVYQQRDVLLKRMPDQNAISDYVSDLKGVVHNFYVGESKPEILHIVLVVRPGRRSRAWIMSSARPDGSPELGRLRRLVESVRPLEVLGGPVALALSGTVAGGDGSELLEGEAYRNPVPPEWRARAAALRDPPPFSSDAFLDLVFP